MDFSFNEEQEMLRRSARDFLAAECPKSVVRELEASATGHSPELWAKMAGLGWMGLSLPEGFGGAGLGLMELAILFEEIGRAAMPGPLFSDILLGALPLLDFGSDAQKKAILPRVASGETILTLALSEPEARYDPKFIGLPASAKGSGRFEITGTKLFVPYAAVADHLLTVARTNGSPGDENGLTVFIIGRESKGISLIPLKTIAGDRQYEVTFDGVSLTADSIVGRQNRGIEVITPALARARVIQCAEMVGGAQQELEMTADYTKKRVQFGRPIGSFQAVQHRMADMYVDVQGARWATYQAVWRVAQGLPADRDVAMAKAFTDIACQRVALSAQQLHAGIGFDRDYDIQFYYRRAKAFDLKLGSTAFHLKSLEPLLETIGKERSWVSQWIR